VVKNNKIKQLEWLEVQIVMQNKHNTKQDRIEFLDNVLMIDRLWNENETSWLLPDTSVILQLSISENSCRVIYRAQSLHGDWKEHVRCRELRLFLALLEHKDLIAVFVL